MLNILSTTFPIYLLILLGVVAVRWGYIDGAHIAGLGQFALKICMPALIISAIAFPRTETALDLSFFGAYLLGSVATLLLGVTAVRLLLRQSRPDSWILSMGMANSNSGYMGFPVASLFFGADAAVVFAMTVVIECAVTIPLPMIAASAAGDKPARLSELLRNAVLAILRNPLIIAVGVAVLIRISGVPVAEPVEKAVGMLAGVAAPLALFIIGGTVARMSFSGHWRRSGAVSVGKLIVHPALVALMLMLVPGVPPTLIPIGILFAAMPMVTIYPILSAPFGLSAVTSTALLASTTASCVTISVVLALISGL
ncbi:AEC family transporter [Pararhodobacter sp.]|uniref:AEC family transporter n=1 Tax=Pararhodobacter sp. TaxID=2127056 RepID=UPI002AFE6DCE|nr:AEC family transporter [Pararhodobacter sp.]